MELSNNNTIIPIHPEAETARIIQHNKPCSITNGILKRHNHHHHYHPVPVVVVYKECLKNHAATMGANAVDGCGEFMPSPTATATNPTSLKCAACGCHRNFHRREPEEPFPPAAALEYQSHHRHHPPPPPPPPTTNRGSGDHSCPNSPSPPPISSAYYPAAPHMLLALSFGLSGRPVENNHLPINPNSTTPMSNPNGRKRFRTKFTQNQKERMLEFAERVGWRMQKQHEEVINKLCDEISVEKGVLKVWMHNNKNNFGRKDQTVPNNDMDMNGIDFGTNDNNKEDSHSHGVNHNNIVSLVTTNGSSSSLT